MMPLHYMRFFSGFNHCLYAPPRDPVPHIWQEGLGIKIGPGQHLGVSFLSLLRAWLASVSASLDACAVVHLSRNFNAKKIGEMRPERFERPTF